MASAVLLCHSQQMSPRAAAAASIRAEQGEPHEASEGERRQLTVMFCDLVDSTALSERLDPEELRDLMRSYQEVCVDAITSFDGYVAKYLGDGFWRTSAIRRRMKTMPSRGAGRTSHHRKLRGAQLSHAIHVRVGIHTGLVVAGEMGSRDYPEHRAIVGETPNSQPGYRSRRWPTAW